MPSEAQVVPAVRAELSLPPQDGTTADAEAVRLAVLTQAEPTRLPGLDACRADPHPLGVVLDLLLVQAPPRAVRGWKRKAREVYEAVTQKTINVPLFGEVAVTLRNDDGSWFVEGNLIDYAAEGTSQHDALERFTTGLTATAHEHIRKFGSTSRLWRREHASGVGVRKEGSR